MQTNTNYRIILASTSPRRKQILEMLGLPFEVIPADIDESVLEGETPSEYVQRLAVGKAQKVARQTGSSLLEQAKTEKVMVIGGDVTVDVDGIALAKAESKAEAAAMIGKLQGRSHFIRDGYALLMNGEVYASGVVSAQVTFGLITSVQLEEYLEVGDWEGKAGAYAIQGASAEYITALEGSFFDVLGLPIFQIYAALLTAGVQIPVSLDAILAEDNAKKALLFARDSVK